VKTKCGECNTECFGWQCKDDYTPSAATAAVVEDDDECTIVPVGLCRQNGFQMLETRRYIGRLELSTVIIHSNATCESHKSADVFVFTEKK
jgi:hypothetical protein